MTIFDHLDIWTLPRAVFQLMRGQRVLFMTRSAAGPGSCALRLVEALGGKFSQLPSPYIERVSRDSYIDLSIDILNVMANRLEPGIAERLRAFDETGGTRNSRLARYIALCYYRPIKRGVEAVFAAAQNNHGGVVYIERTGAVSAVQSYGADHGLRVKPYRAPGRFSVKPRDGFFDMETTLWPGALFWAAIKGHVVFALFAAAGLLRKGVSRPTPDDWKAIRSDIIAITARPNPNPQLDDLFWAPNVRAEGVRVLALHSAAPDESCRTYYDRRSDGFFRTRDILSARRTGAIWNALRSQILLDALAGPFRILRCCASPDVRLPPLWAALISLMRLNETFYAAVLKTTGAKAGWSMTEGHEINTQALAVACHDAGGVALGTCWSLLQSPSVASANNRNDVTFVWGARQEMFLKDSKAVSEAYVRTGYPLNTEPKREMSDRHRTLCFYDNAAGHDTPVHPDAMAAAYRAILQCAADFPDLRVIIKGKRTEYRGLEPEITARIDQAIAEDRISFDDVPGNLEAGLNADIVAGVTAATLPLLAAQYGVRCVLFEPEGFCRRWPLRDMPNVTICDTPAAYASALEEACRKECRFSPYPGQIDVFADGLATTRIAAYISALSMAFRAGADRSNAMQDALARCRAAVPADTGSVVDDAGVAAGNHR